MTRGARNGLVLAAIHLAIVGSLGVKLLVDRATLPRVWVRTAPVDPNLPIRGRYVSLRLAVDRFEEMRPVTPAPSPVETNAWVRDAPKSVQLSVRDGQMVATGTERETGVQGVLARRGDQAVVWLDPVAFFIPESVADPSIRRAGEELWVEVTVPRRGAPRPIRVGVKANGRLTPLVLR